MKNDVSKTEDIQAKLDEALSKIDVLSEENRTLKEDLQAKDADLKMSKKIWQLHRQIPNLLRRNCAGL